MPPSSAQSEPARAAPDYSGEAEQLRASVKWLAGVLGAIAIAFVGGLGAADIRDADDWWWLAVIGFLLGIVGVGVGVYFTARVLLPEPLSEERSFAEADKQRELAHRPLGIDGITPGAVVSLAQTTADKPSEIDAVLTEAEEKVSAETLPENAGEQQTWQAAGTVFGAALARLERGATDAVDYAKDQHASADATAVRDRLQAHVVRWQAARQEVAAFVAYSRVHGARKQSPYGLIGASFAVAVGIALVWLAVALGDGGQQAAPDTTVVVTPTVTLAQPKPELATISEAAPVFVWLGPADRKELDETLAEFHGASVPQECQPNPDEPLNAFAVGGDWSKPVLVVPAVKAEPKGGKEPSPPYVCKAFFFEISDGATVVEPRSTSG